MTYNKHTSVVFLFILYHLCMYGQSTDSIAIDKVVNIASSQYQSYIDQFPDSSRHLYSLKPDASIQLVGYKDWTSGFFPGCLWQIYEITKNPVWKTLANKWTKSLEPAKWLTDKHDLGFILFTSFGNGYRLTNDSNYSSILLQGARSLSQRFDPIIKSIRSWDNGPWHYPVIVDNLMNLELLFWATKQSGDSSFYNIAVSHINNDLLYRFRSDGSTYHVLDFDPVSGHLLARKTWQGFSDSSCWARGQAWAIYGLTMAYRYTKNVSYLLFAKKAADSFIMQLEKIPDYIPYWDFNDTAIPNSPKDVSAAAIAASGLLELSQLSSGSGKKYYKAAKQILQQLCTSEYLARPGTNDHFLLKHSVVNKPSGKGIDVPVIYADYYFLQALDRYKKYKPL